jgi:sugar/nucleoside kinase (ribokinase family)
MMPITNSEGENSMSNTLILGMGNALTDILVPANDALLAEYQLPKGSMQWVDADRAQQLVKRIEAGNRCAGGCAANTICGLGELGVKSAFIGKIGQDPTGDFFESDLKSHAVDSRLFRATSASGTALTFMTPDGERTFAVHLGAAVELVAEELIPEQFADADYFHIEGYLVQNHELIATAIDMAKAAGATVSIDLASYNVVEENLEFIKSLLNKGLDIVFANEQEALAFTGQPEEKALAILAEQCQIAIVKLGGRGSLIAKGQKREFLKTQRIDPIDTTGAGDLYATGFLYGLAKGLDLATCGRIASCVAGEIIQVQGTKLAKKTWRNIKQKIQSIATT